MFAAIFISVNAIQTDLNLNGFVVSDLFKNPVFFTLIISVLSTYGIWLIASLLMFDPWHMFTSLVQYMLLSPTFTNILNVYAFCNTHDISWGTKGDDKAEKLPSVSTKDGQGKTDLPDEGDLNAQYEKELAVFTRKEPVVKKVLTPSQLEEKQLDYYRGVRTVVVLVWMIMNFALVALVLSTAGLEKLAPGSADRNTRATIYMAAVLYSVAAMAAFKFIGAMWFLIVRMFRGV
jgi:chitin synthase